MKKIDIFYVNPLEFPAKQIPNHSTIFIFVDACLLVIS